jgi:hypothetical protein
MVLAGVLGAALAVGCGSAATNDTTPPPAPPPPTGPALPPLISAVTLGCGFAPQPDLHNTCPKMLPQYNDDVVGAVNYVLGNRPDLVNGQQVLDHRGYTNAVVERLRQLGYCAIDQLEEIAVKRDNRLNEQYNIWTSNGTVRFAYISTCIPAQF